jgi:hypothetical protein
MSKKSKKPAIPFNVFADYSDLVMKSIFKNIADKCHSQAKELAPNGINFEPYEEFKGPPPHTNQRCTMTPMENKMDEVKTVTYEGQVYEIGKYYLFNDGGDYWHFLRLKRLVVGSPLRFEVWITASKFTVFSYISEVPASECMGTITPAPIELVDGAAYMFDYHENRKSAIGVYSKTADNFITVGNNYFTDKCTNIRLMTVESKQ